MCVVVRRDAVKGIGRKIVEHIGQNFIVAKVFIQDFFIRYRNAEVRLNIGIQKLKNAIIASPI